MKKVDMHSVIKQKISLLGNSCKIMCADGEDSVVAIIDPVWPRTKSRFEGIYSKIGEVNTDYSIYIGPYDYDITRLSRDDTVISNGKSYYFVRADGCYVGGALQYYTGVLKRIYEEDDYEL